MEDSPEDRSSESLPTSDEFEVVGKNINFAECKTLEKTSPDLQIADNENLEQLQQKLSEVLDEDAMTRPAVPEETGSKKNEGYVLFNRVAYLGAASINAPRSETEIQRNMVILSQQSSGQPIEVSLSIPNNAGGAVILYDSLSQVEMAHYPIHRILFFARGMANSAEFPCFAFTCARGDSQETAIFQCHVFRCDIPEAIHKVFLAFGQAFREKSDSDIPSVVKANLPNLPVLHQNPQEFVFELTLEIREEDSKGNFSAVPKDRNYFKIRSGVEKKVVITVQQISEGIELTIERCFGLLVTAGRNVKHSDMHLLEMVSMGTSSSEKKSSYVITGHWDPSDPALAPLNRETRDQQNFDYMTVAVDLVIQGIREPVRFVMETKAKIFPQHERFWYFSRKQLILQYGVLIREIEEPLEREMASDRHFQVVTITNLGEIERPGKTLGMGMSLSLNLSSLSSLTSSTFGSLQSPPASMDTPVKDDELSDNDEPLLSGSGEVSKDCSEQELTLWAEVLSQWNQNNQKSSQLSKLVKRGIPEALRGEVWLRLTEAFSTEPVDIMDAYRVLITKECSFESVILRDIHRTFPAHEFFKDSGGTGQEALAKLSRAYAVFDEEVGYCQGLSFLAAALLLHMPEEQAFCVLVRIMFNYGLRDLFKDGFEALHLRLYQLDRLLEEHIPDLWAHLVACGVETHMFGSQWFLTLFTAKFPLFLVFHILDVFLLQGMDTIFLVALGLLSTAKKDLLALNFEGILKYFRVHLPKRYRSEEAARQLMKLACSFKPKKIKKYEKEWHAIKEQERMQQDPLQRLELENKRLREANLRLERESDDLAQELITSKITLRAELDSAEERADVFSKEVQGNRKLLAEADEDRKRLQEETQQLKDMLKREVQQAESESTRNQAIISDYKKICSQLSERLDRQQQATSEVLEQLKEKLGKCLNCSDGLKMIEDLSQERPLSPTAVAPPELGEIPQLRHQVRELELELAQTKLALVEAQCRNQDLLHQLSSVNSELQASRNTWLQKTLSSIKEVTKKEAHPTPPYKEAGRSSEK